MKSHDDKKEKNDNHNDNHNINKEEGNNSQNNDNKDLNKEKDNSNNNVEGNIENNKKNVNDNKNNMDANNDNKLHEKININNEEQKKIVKNRSHKNIKKHNQKIIIESKDKTYNKNFPNGQSNFSSSKTKNMFTLSNSKRKKQKKIKPFKKTNILYSMNQFPLVIDKEGLLMQILQSRKEVEIMENEIYKLKKRRKKLEQKFLANKLIIEGILDIKDENDTDNHNNINATFKYINENINDKIETDNDKDKENNNKFYSEINKTESNTFYNKSIFNSNYVINSLKKQIINCDQNIKNKDEIMESKINHDRVNKFLDLNSIIEQKNRELEQLVSKSQALQYIILDIETRIEYFAVKTKNYIDNTNKLNEKLKNNWLIILKNEKQINSLNLEKEEILKKIKKLEDTEKDMNAIICQKKEKKKNVDDELKTVEDVILEKSKNEKQFTDIDKQEIIIKKSINKNENIIINITSDIKYSEKKIEKYLNERNNLIAKSNIPKKIRDKLKQYDNEINNIKKEIKDNKKLVNEHDKTKSQLIKKINELSEELKNKNERNLKIEEDLNQIKNKYEKEIPKEYKLLYKKKFEELVNGKKNDEET
jgi:hypothetical protein